MACLHSARDIRAHATAYGPKDAVYTAAALADSYMPRASRI